MDKTNDVIDTKLDQSFVDNFTSFQNCWTGPEAKVGKWTYQIIAKTA